MSIRAGRLLYSKLGLKGFSTFFVLIIGLPISIFIYGVYLSRHSSTVIIENFVLIFIGMMILIPAFSILAYWRVSYCNYCHSPYATVPIKREVIGKMEYKDGELYKKKEYRLCELCNKIYAREYTDRYTRESNNSILN